ncbi:MAG: alcohol dehydrogenase catalytic domain-containing protein [Gaiella sp.]
MRAVVVDPSGRPIPAEVPEPDGSGAVVRVRACGLCGSDLEKLTPSFAGRVLGHEVVAETGDGHRVALVHHAPCGVCARCHAGHESTCEAFRVDTILPGGFAERVVATAGWVELPGSLDDVRGTAVEPLACVLRGAERVPPGRVLVVGRGFIGRLFEAVLERRGEEVFGVDHDPRRAGREPDGSVDAVVLCAPGGVETALARLAPGGTLLVFADAGAVPADAVYRRELTVVGSRSATPRHMREAVALLPELELPPQTTFPFERIDEALAALRGGDVVKAVLVP